jgi:hypothetical protein
MAFILSFVQAIPFTEDIFIMSAFIVGFMLWDRCKIKDMRIGTHVSRTFRVSGAQGGGISGRCAAKAPRKEADISECCRVPRKCAVQAPTREVDLGPESQSILAHLPEHDNAQVMEEKMIKLLESKRFRHALNLFRFVRRSVGIHEYTENLFLPFIQSAIRVGKMDVVEYMLKSMAEIPTLSAPSQHFWRTVLLYLASRKEFGSCLVAHGIFGSKIRLDSPIFQCLMTAEMEMGVPEKERKMLKRLVLHHGLHQDPTAVLNNHLRCCIKEERPLLAVQTLRDAQMLDKREGLERLVGPTSYKIVIMGLVRNRNSSASVELFNELLALGLELEKEICKKVMDCCVRTGHMEAARKIEALLETTLILPNTHTQETGAVCVVQCDAAP